VFTSGPGEKGPWYAVWLAPALYVQGNAGKSAELDLMENFDYPKEPADVNRVRSCFSTCEGYPCSPSRWEVSATRVNHHITVQVTREDGDHVIRIHRCTNPRGKNLTTCKNGQTATIRNLQNFPIWQKDVAKERYAKYWLVSDIWWTSDTNFMLRVDNVKFFNDDNTEWKMALNGDPPEFQSIRRRRSSVVV